MVKDFSAIRIKLASPEEILSWSHGEVTKAETINYRTFRAELDGLMDEKIFGPSKDFECFCGKYKKVRYKGIVCDRCGVEVTTKRVRRERMGHIKLVSPVTHVWFSNGVPNKLALLLDVPQKKLETVIYYARYLVTSVDEAEQKKALESIDQLKEDEAKQLEADLEAKLAEISAGFEEKTKQLRKEEKEEKNLGIQLERLQAAERKEIAHIKSAFNQKRDNLDQKFSDLKDLTDNITIGSTLSEEEFSQLDGYYFTFFTADMGAPAIRTLLEGISLDETIAELDREISTTKSELKKNRAVQRKRLLTGMMKADVKPEWIVMDILPVLPPDLRPIIQLPGGRFATSDMNDLYRRVINRNNRLRRLIELGAPQVILRNERRMLQEAVDALLDNQHRPGAPTTNSRGLPYKSLSDLLRGKQGRFRQNLLGKRVDYSGRAVIVSGPELRFDQCGLPKTIALELFKPFIIRELIARDVATNPAKARLIYEEKLPVVWDILEEVSKGRPVLLNRAPTLHKQGIVAFYPVLIEGNAIQLHPMLCKGFNADFDGDQMAVHLPLSRQAVEEVKERMFAPSNMLSMASGQPIMNTEKDMALGVYFLTLMKGEPEEAKHAFSDTEELLAEYNLRQITLYEPVKLLLKGEIVTTTAGRVIFNNILPEDYPFMNNTLNKKKISQITSDIFNKYGRDVAIEVLDQIKNLGFKYASISGFSLSMGEFEFGGDQIVDERMAQFHEKEDSLIDDFNEGLSTKEDLSRLSKKAWMDAADQIGEEVWKAAAGRSVNLVHLNNSGAVPVDSWVKMISGVRGYVSDVQGNVVSLPLADNYKNGMGSTEYFVAAKATRKSFADVALKTAESGYLTRRLCDVAQDIVVQADDCGSTEGIYLSKSSKRNLSFSDQIRGRYLAEDVVDPATGEIWGKVNEQLSLEMAKKIESSETINKVKLRSPMTCRRLYGICSHCYGNDLGTSKTVGLGEAVGIIAAQAMGEPTTQLTLKNKSDARAAGDVTQGLPRIEELLEIRTPKAKALIADIAGTVKIIQNEDEIILRISSVKKLRKTFEVAEGDKIVAKRASSIAKGLPILVKADGTEIKAEFDGIIEYGENKVYLLIDKELESEMPVDNMSSLLVKNDDEVNVGQQLTYGSVDPKEMAAFVSIQDAQRYIVEGVQSVYTVYGIQINDVHIELIVAQMAKFCQIADGGDTDWMPGEFKYVLEMAEMNEQLKAEGKRQIQYERVLLGLTNAALRTESFLSAASFEQQVRVLTDAALIGKVDHLRGLKENVIIGRPVPIGNVFLHKQLGEDITGMELNL